MIDTLPTAPPEAPAEPTTPIRPSEALRLGRLLRPWRTKHTFFYGSTGACALGSMLAGVGVVAGDPSWVEIALEFPEMGLRFLDCPAADCNEFASVDELVGDLNDEHGWSDAQIADWLIGLGL